MNLIHTEAVRIPSTSSLSHGQTAPRHRFLAASVLEEEKTDKLPQGSPPITMKENGETGLGEKEWTFLFFLDGNNSLEPALVQTLVDLERVGSDSHINIVACLARAPQEKVEELWREQGYAYTRDNVDGDWSGARIYRVTRSSDSRTIDSPVLMDIGAVDTANPTLLRNLLQTGMKAFPAKRYAVVLASHGGGFVGMFRDDLMGHSMGIKDLAQALKEASHEAGKRIDFLGLDACLMAQAEVVEAMKGTAKVLVASEDQEGYTYLHWPYSKVLNQVREMEGKMEAGELAGAFVRESRGQPDLTPSLSAVDLTKASELKRGVDELAGALLSSLSRGEEPQQSGFASDEPSSSGVLAGQTSALTTASVLAEIVQETQGFVLQEDARKKPFGSYRDLYDFTSRLAYDERIMDQGIRGSARNLLRILREVVFAEQHAGSGLYRARGLSIYIPEEREELEQDRFHYLETVLARETRWGEFLKKLLSWQRTSPSHSSSTETESEDRSQQSGVR